MPETCSRERCGELCYQILECGHPCVGLCGERCPDACIICTPTKTYFDDSFLQVDVQNVKGMDHHVSAICDRSEFGLLTCPYCRSIIYNYPLRYSNEMKGLMEILAKLKTKISLALSKVELAAIKDEVIQMKLDICQDLRDRLLPSP